MQSFLVSFLLLISIPGHWSLLRSVRVQRSLSIAVQASLGGVSEKDMMRFGKKMNIHIRLPTRDREIVSNYLEDVDYILANSWDPTKCTKLSPTTYLLKFVPIPIPGVDVVTPEIEVEFENRDGVIHMSSGNCTLRGMSGNIRKDTRFMDSFRVNLRGQLNLASAASATMTADTSTAASLKPFVATEGWVVYEIQGEKPKLLRAAPSFILDNVIEFIQNSVADFVNKDFSAKLLRSFKVYYNRRHGKP